MMHSVDRPDDAAADARWRTLTRLALIGGFFAFLAWEAWWAVSLYKGKLFFCDLTWNPFPLFGADFFSQSDLAARLYAKGIDPYASRGHLFHYPPLVIWSFSWTPFLRDGTALRIWVVACIAIMIAGTVVAVKVRDRLPVRPIPLFFALAVVMYSFPVLFQLERANFDLITLLAMVLAYPLLNKGTPKAEFLAGCLLAAGPWVKLYPGLMGLGLLALRRWHAVAGFIVAGVVIFALAPSDTLASFETLRIAVDRMKGAAQVPYYAWSHSLSVAWMMLLRLGLDTPLAPIVTWPVANGLTALSILAPSLWVSWRVYQVRNAGPLLYPLLLWLNALGSCFGLIANDYSLVFWPLAVVAVHSFRDPWYVQLGFALSLVAWQPFNVGLHGLPLFFAKMSGLIAVGFSLTLRARELGAKSPVKDTVARPEAAAEGELPSVA